MTTSSSGLTGHAQGVHTLVSPISGEVLGRFPLASASELTRVVDGLGGAPPPFARDEVYRFLHRLRGALSERREDLVRLTVLETGFTLRDTTEAIEGTLAFLDEFPRYAETLPESSLKVIDRYSSPPEIRMDLRRRPYRCVGALVPQNASLSLSVIIIASALFAGSRVFLRTSLQTAATTALLAEAVRESSPPRGRIEIVTSAAADFLAVCTGSSAVDLVHYIGSGRYTEEVLRASYAAGKVCLLDGSGNGLLYVDESFDVERAAEIIRAGATRLNGETCTSINGVLVDPTIHSRLRDAVVEAFGTLRMGDPRKAEVDVGPLFGPRHAEALDGSLRAGAPTGRLLSGGRAEGAYFRPAVVDGVERSDPIVGEGFFGPAVWIGAVAAGELEPWLRRNRYPLCDTVLSHRPEVIETMATASPAARLCINTDPSVESMFEPWGGYPPGGLNPVSVWTDKYQQTYQVARPV